MFEDNAITHRYSGRFTTSVSASRADFSISDGSSFGSELSVEFVGNTLFSSRHSKFSSTLYSDKIDNSYRVSATSSLFTKRLTNQVYRDFTTGGSGGSGGSGTTSSSGGWSTSQSAPGDAQPGGRPSSGATGELDPNFASPVGDVLLPMMLMIGVYAVVRLWRNRKLLFKSK